jgi:hypothetical protein
MKRKVSDLESEVVDYQKLNEENNDAYKNQVSEQLHEIVHMVQFFITFLILYLIYLKFLYFRAGQVCVESERTEH